MSDFFQQELSVRTPLVSSVADAHRLFRHPFAPLSLEAVAVTPKRVGRLHRVRHHRTASRRQYHRASNVRRVAHKLSARAHATRTIERALRITQEPHSWMRSHGMAGVP